VCLVCWVCALAHAADSSGLYATIVSPTMGKTDSAFVEALRLVAVKATGMRDAGARITATIPNLRTYVQRFEPVRGDGSVLIEFDPAAVDRLLTTLGLPLWARERPGVLVWLSVPDANGRPSWIAADQQSVERDLVERAAQARGLPLIWPAMDGADLATAASLLTARSSRQALLASADRYRADAVLFGVATRDAAGGSSVQWSFAIGDANVASDEPIGAMQTSLEEGIQVAADRCASLFAVSSNARSDIPVQIVGIHNLDAYAGALNYLQGLTIVLNVAVEQLSGDALHLRVAVRGNSATLRHAVELKRRLAALVVDTASVAAPGDDSLRLRYLQ